MAQQTINPGTAPNNLTGDPLRTIVQKVNANFTDLYSGKANATDLAAEIAAREAAITAEQNARSTADALKAELTQVVRTDADQSLDATKRLQHAVNAGTLIGIPFQVVAPTVAIAAATWQLPPLPADFRLHSVDLTIRAAHNATLSFTLTKETDNVIAPVASAGIVGAGTGLVIHTTLANALIEGGKQLTFALSNFTSVYGGESSFGLCLWFRGVWMA